MKAVGGTVKLYQIKIAMRTFQFVVFVTVMGICSTVHAQKQIQEIIVTGQVNDTSWLPKHSVDILKLMKIVYRKPTILNEVKGMECFDDNVQLKATLTCVGQQLHSKDGEFIAFISMYKPFSKQDSIGLQKLMPRHNFDHIDKQHTNHIRRDIRNSLGKEAALQWKQHVTYYALEDAKSKFNADSAIIFPIKLDPNYDFYKGKYSHLETLYLQKKGRGFINFYCFYTDKAKKKLPAYRKAIEKTFRYEN